MRSVFFFNGLEPTELDFNDLQYYIADEVKHRMRDTYVKGVAIGGSNTPGQVLNPPYIWTDGLTLGIFGLIAFDEYGNRIYVAPNTLGSNLPANQKLLPDANLKLVPTDGLTNTVGTYYLVIRYNQAFDDTSKKAQAVTGVLIPTRIDNAYDLYLRQLDGVTAGDVILGTITYDNTGHITLVDESSRDVFKTVASQISSSVNNPNIGLSGDGGDFSNVTFEDHINMLGTGIWSIRNPHALSAADLGIDVTALAQHQYFLHSDGIRTLDVLSTASALYPYYTNTSLTDDASVVVQPLSQNREEIVVVNGKSIEPISISEAVTFSFDTLNSPANIGYYIIAVDSVAAAPVRIGPFSFTTQGGEDVPDTPFFNVFNDRRYFPICSLKWDLVNNTIQTNYDIDPNSFVDRRKFGNTTIRDMGKHDVSFIRDGAPLTNNNLRLFYGRCKAAIKLPYYPVAGNTPLTFQAIIDGIQLPAFTFQGVQALTIDQLLEQLNVYFDTNSQMTPTGVSQGMAVMDGRSYLTILGTRTVQIGTGTSNTVFGFTPTNKNMIDDDGMLKTVITDGPYNSVEELIYSSTTGNLSRVEYSVDGTLSRYQQFNYVGDLLSSVNEVVVP